MPISNHVLFELSRKDEIGQHRKSGFSGFSWTFCHQNIYKNRNSNLTSAPLFLHIHIHTGWRENVGQSPWDNIYMLNTGCLLININKKTIAVIFWPLLTDQARCQRPCMPYLSHTNAKRRMIISLSHYEDYMS